MTTRLSSEQQQAVLYWPTAAEVPVFPADTKRKKISLKGWQETDFAKIDFRSKLENGDYDDGIAIRTGKTIFGKYCLIAIDFDGIDAVLEWFGNWEQVIHFAKQTRIEWHGDKWRIHVFLFADRPIRNKRIHVKNSLLEVKCERQALFVSPSIHKEGNPYSPLDTDKIATIDENLLLQLESKIMPGYGATEALSAVITAFREDGKLSIDRAINAKGLYWINNKLVPVRLEEEYHSAYDKFVSLPAEERQKIGNESVEFIEYLIKNFKPDVISAALKIGVISPANFALKQYTNDIFWIPSLFTYGWPRTGKTTISVIPSALYFPFMSISRKRPFTSINSEARFGYFMCQDTLPACVNEMKALDGQDPKAIIMIEMLKSAIETQESRSVMDNTSTYGRVYPSLRHVNFSSNAPPPRDVALRARLIIKNFTQKDSHNEVQKKAFHKYIGLNIHKLRLLGSFAIGYLCQYPEVLFKPRIEDVNWEEAAKEIITKFYELAGLPRPGEWLDLPLTDDEDDEDYETDEINNTAAALRTCLLNHFNETYNKYIRNLGDKITDSDGRQTNVTTDLNLRQRIAFCIDKNLTPHFKGNSRGKLIIFHSILNEMQRHGVESDQIGSLKQLAEVLGMKYGSLRQNNRPVKCVYDSEVDKLADFLAGNDHIE